MNKMRKHTFFFLNHVKGAERTFQKSCNKWVNKLCFSIAYINYPFLYIYIINLYTTPYMVTIKKCKNKYLK